jgi:hypothetical protein
MKWIATLALVLVSMQAVAEDRRLGPVVAVERDIPNVFQACVDKVKLDPKNPTTIFSCTFPVTKNKAEFSVGQQNLLNLYKEGCSVEGTVQGTTLLIMFGTNPGRTNFESAKVCLRKALDASPDGDRLKFIVYSVE